MHMPPPQQDAITAWLVAVAASTAVAAALYSLKFYYSFQRRIEAALERQGVRGQYPRSWPLLGHLGRYADESRLELASMDPAADDDDDAGGVSYLTNLGHPLLVVTDATLSRALWDASKAWPKSTFYYQSMDVLFGTKRRTLATHARETDPAWHCKRETVSRALQQKYLRGAVAPFIAAQVEALCENWTARRTGIDVDRDITDLTLRVILYFVFGRDDLSVDDVRPLVDALNDMVNFAWRMAGHPWRVAESWIPGSKPYRASRAFRQYVRRLISQARLSTSALPPHALVTALLKQQAAHCWPEEVLENEIMTLIFAGHDTTAHATTIALQECLTHGDVVRTIRCEHDALRASNNVAAPPLDATAFYYHMKWPLAAWKESLRLNAETPGGTVREAPADTWIEASSSTADSDSRRRRRRRILVPAGCAVLSPMYTFLRSVGNYGPTARRFRPERFVRATTTPSAAETGRGDEQSSCPSYPCSYVPFSLGKRNCVGMPLAYLEGAMLLGHLLTHLDIAVESPVRRRWVMTLRAENMKISVTKRKDI